MTNPVNSSEKSGRFEGKIRSAHENGGERKDPHLTRDGGGAVRPVSAAPQRERQREREREGGREGGRESEIDESERMRESKSERMRENGIEKSVYLSSKDGFRYV